MAYTSIASSEIEVGQPVDQELLQKVKDNFDFFNAEFLNRDSMNAVVNGSFENASSNMPENWTITLYTGGAATYQDATTDVMHGKGALTFVHPGGAGNGGGYITSDYFPVSTVQNGHVVASYLLKTNATLIGNEARLLWYDKDKNLISYNSFCNEITWNTARVYRKVGMLVPPSSAKFAQIRIHCGTTENTTTGRMTIDNVVIDNMGHTPSIVTYDASTQSGDGTTGSSGWKSVTTFYVDLPKSNSTYMADISVSLALSVPSFMNNPDAVRLKDGTTYINIYEATTYLSLTQTTDTGFDGRKYNFAIKTTGGRVPIAIEAHQSGGTALGFSARKSSPFSECRIVLPKTS